MKPESPTVRTRERNHPRIASNEVVILLGRRTERYRCLARPGMLVTGGFVDMRLLNADWVTRCAARLPQGPGQPNLESVHRRPAAAQVWHRTPASQWSGGATAGPRKCVGRRRSGCAPQDCQRRASETPHAVRLNRAIRCPRWRPSRAQNVAGPPISSASNPPPPLQSATAQIGPT